MLFPTIVLALRWRRFTAAGAIASVVSGISVLLLITRGVLPRGDLEPVAPALLVAFVVAILGSLASRPPSPARIALAFTGETEDRNPPRR